MLIVTRDAADLLQIPDLALLDKSVRHCAGNTSNEKDTRERMHRRKKERLAQTLVELSVGEDEEVVGALGDKGHVRDIVLGCRNDTSEL